MAAEQPRLHLARGAPKRLPLAGEGFSWPCSRSGVTTRSTTSRTCPNTPRRRTTGSSMRPTHLAVQRLMADGVGFGGEGDWKTSVVLRAAKVMVSGLPGGTSFMEDYTYHLVPGEEKILGAHMLEVCPTIASGTPTLEIHPLGIGGREDPVRLVFDAAPAAAVVIGVIDIGDRFRFIANEVEVVAPDAPLPKLPVARAVWRPSPDLRTSTESWLTAGGPHHTVLSTALTSEHLWDLAEMTGTELALIDNDTTTRRFTQELRWNQAYYRLAQGF